MVNYLFYQNISLNLLSVIDEINFFYHINSFDWPIEHSHVDYWEFTIITNGSIVNYVNGSSKTYDAGMVFVSTTSDRHSLRKKNNQPIRYITLLVKENFILNVLNTLNLDRAIFNGVGSYCILPNSKIAEIEELLLHIDYSVSKKYFEHDKITCSVFLDLLSSFISMESFNNLKIPPWRQKLNKLAQSEKLLTFDVNNLCSELGYSRTQLNTIFKKAFNISPHDYLVNYKFTYAKTLLLNTTDSISTIANKIGFSNAMPFYVNFKKLFGMTPATFREKTTPTQ